MFCDDVTLETMTRPLHCEGLVFPLSVVHFNRLANLKSTYIKVTHDVTDITAELCEKVRSLYNRSFHAYRRFVSSTCRLTEKPVTAFRRYLRIWEKMNISSERGLHFMFAESREWLKLYYSVQLVLFNFCQSDRCRR